MKIVQIINCTFPDNVGGAEVSAQELRNELRRLGHDVVVCTLGTKYTSSELPADVKALRLFNLYDPWREKHRPGALARAIWKIVDFFNPVMLVRLWALLRCERPQVVITHNLKGFSVSAWLAPKLVRAKLIHVIHDYYLVCSTCALGRPGERRCTSQCGVCKLYSLPKKFCAQLVDQFVGVSQFVGDTHIGLLGLDRRKMEIIGNVRSTCRVSEGAEGRVFAPAGVLRVGFLGRLETAKGLHVLVEALAKSSIEWELFVAGKESEPGYRSSCAAIAKGSRINWLGHVEPSVLFELIDCLVVPSLWDEPFPAVAYEPQIYGVLVLASEVGGIKDIVRNRETGYTYPCDDTASLTALLEEVARKPADAERVRLQALKESKRFSDVEAFGASYNALLGR